MSDTAKTVLIVAGAGVGVFVLLKLVAPPPARVSNTRNTSIGTLAGLAELGGAIKGLFSSSSSSPKLSAADQAIFDTVTDKETGAVDLSGVYAD